MSWSHSPFANLVKKVRATHADDAIARHCGVMLSTVGYWADGSMYPHPKAIPVFESKLRELLTADLDDAQNAVRVAKQATGED